MLRRTVAVALVGCAALAAGCSSEAPEDELMVVESPTAAKPARSPAATEDPAGTVTSVDRPATAVAVDAETGVLGVAVTDPPAVLLYDLAGVRDRDPVARARSVPLPGPADTLTLAEAGGPLLAAVGATGTLVRVPLPDGPVTEVDVRGEPVSAAREAETTLVAVRDHKAVAVLGADDRVDREISGGLLSADQVLSTDRGTVVLDRLRNAVFEVDVAAGEVNNGLRAGMGSTNAVTDRYGRVLVADTRGGALLAFSLDPLLLRQNYPVPGTPYGIAYDRDQDLVWLTLTETNEVVGYHVAGEEPTLRHRFPTVEQPNAVTVDPTSGRVIVASATGKGVQVISP